MRPMKLIVGLGNPGRQYQRTPHNAGFEVVDILLDRHKGMWAYERRFEAEVAEISLSGTRVALMRPLTYMNLSGRAVASFVGKNGGEPGEILVISDDINLPLGQLRLRPGGSHGGHKGLLSIINSIGSLDFPRLRIGVKPEGADVDDWVSFVLRQLPPAERETLLHAEQLACDAVEMIVQRDLSAAMNQFNRKSGKAGDSE